MSEDPTTERLLQLAGRRPDVPAVRATSVRAALHDAWRREVRRRRNRRLLMRTATTAAVAASLTWVVAVRPRPAVTSAPVVASIERAERFDDRRAGELVRAGEWITTKASARVALRTPAGTSIRLDEHSRARLTSESTVEVTAGAVYLDTGTGAPALEIRTPFGNITDVGTQFEVRLIADMLRVRVRTGAVAVRHERQSIRVDARTELILTSSGAQSRAIQPFGGDWRWAAGLAPRFRFEGQRLDAFLEYVARENGWNLRYEDATLERAASTVVLHGSVDGLGVEAALEVALTIAELSHTLDRGELSVFRRR